MNQGILPSLSQVSVHSELLNQFSLVEFYFSYSNFVKEENIALGNILITKFWKIFSIFTPTIQLQFILFRLIIVTRVQNFNNNNQNI